VPEGDTLHRAAARLEPALTGAVLERFQARRTPPPHPRRGERITGVEAQGKHLLVRFERGLVLDTHMGMTGSWHLYRAGERWRKPSHLARAVIEVEGWTAVCFAAPTVRMSTEPRLDHLGPDLCRPDADVDDCVHRMRALDGSVTIAEALLDQRVCAGVGNVYKSEVCFACRVHPLTPVGDVSDDTARRLIASAARLLQSNLGDGARSTVGGRPGALAVYRRARRPCRRCGTTIRSQRIGELPRSTYWCPKCQPIGRSKERTQRG
jgi:endonuclease-8